MSLQTKTSTTLAAIAISLASITPAFARGNIRDLFNGNYRFCINPPVSDIATDAQLFNAGLCFSFRKTGDRVTGVLFNPSTYGELRICVTGTLNGNTLTGEASETVFLTSEIASVEPRYRGSTPTPWDNNGYLKIANGRVTGYEIEDLDTYTNYITTIHYPTAKLNLDNFHRYNAGHKLPPTSC